MQLGIDRVQCPGQVPLSSQEAEALKASRQSSASQDWLMDSEPMSASNAEDSGMCCFGSAVPLHDHYCLVWQRWRNSSTNFAS